MCASFLCANDMHPCCVCECVTPTPSPPRPFQCFFEGNKHACVVVAVVVFLMLLSCFFMSPWVLTWTWTGLSSAQLWVWVWVPERQQQKQRLRQRQRQQREPFALLTALCKWYSKRFLLTYVFPFVLLLLLTLSVDVLAVVVVARVFSVLLGKSDVCPRFPVAVTTSPLSVGVNRVLILSISCIGRWCKCKGAWHLND